MASIWNEFKKYLGDALPGGALNPELTTNVNESPVPVGMAALRSFLGEAPDELGVSVLHPQRTSVMKVAEPAFAAGTALQVVPLVGALNALRGVKPTYRAASRPSGIPLAQFSRDAERYAAAVGDRMPLYHVTNQPWESNTPRPGTWFSNEAPTADTPFGDTVRVYGVPRDIQMAGPFKRGRDFRPSVDDATAPIVIVDDGLGTTSYIVKDPSVLQEISPAGRIAPLSSLKSKQRGAVNVAPSSNDFQRYYRASTSGSIRPGMFLTPDEAAARQFARQFELPNVSEFSVRPRSSGDESDVERVARALGIHEPGVPLDQYLMQGPDAAYAEAPQMLEELRNTGLDSLLLDDGMSKQRSLYVLDPDIVRKVGPVPGFASGGSVTYNPAEVERLTAPLRAELGLQ